MENIAPVQVGNSAVLFCPKCREVKEVDCFARNAARGSGRAPYCLPCSRIYSREYYHSNPERKARQVIKYRSNPAVAASYLEYNKNFSAERRVRLRGTPEYELSSRLTDARKRAHKKGLPCDLTVEFLLELYQKQGERCAVSGRTMKLGCPGERGPNSMSVDRIDSAAGYVKGNVRLVIWAVNMAMSNWGIEIFLEVCRDVVGNQNRHY